MSWGEDDPGAGWWDEGGEAEAAAQLLDAVERALRSLIGRGVPIRSLTPGPVQGVARLHLADSTVFLVTSAGGAHFGRVVRAIFGHHSLTISTWERSTDGLRITLGGVPGREPAQLWLLGPDQPD
ncbi:MAG: hypothetical protein Q4P07_10915 [Ornithinimicrobium sp.]|uniref:hypothetical protein n=1 Tax=Ornithinimicrobium sp. TaxID=1977084 RepID=UPI0026DF4452|nr:hypothetical protein [Ornithinimicrobium sp.]MDO5740647.1 hypothetical protein [Ornithinimicrobium sp.]